MRINVVNLNFGFILNAGGYAAESLLGTALHLEDRFYDGIVKDGAHLLDGLGARSRLGNLLRALR